MDKPTDGKGNLTIICKLQQNEQTVDFKDLNNIELPKNDEAIIKDELYYEVYVSEASAEANGVSTNDDDVFSTINEDNEFMEYMLNLITINFDSNPLSMQNISNHQLACQHLMELARNHPVKFPIKEINGVPIVTIRGTNPAEPIQWKIYIPETLIQPMLKWFHETLEHCSNNRIYQTVSERFYRDQLYTNCSNYTCDVNCHQWKNLNRQYGHLPPRNVLATP